MTFPTVAARSTPAQEAADTTTHSVALPSGIASGHLLIAFLATDGGLNTLTWTGWTQVFTNNNGACQLACYYRVADGSEGATVSVTSSVAQQSANTAYRITGYDTVQAPEVSAVANGTGTTPNPGGLTPTGGAKDYLWIAACSLDGGLSISAAPASYSNLQTVTSTGAGGVAVGTAEQTLNAASENPGAFTSGSEDWHARVVAVHPGSGGTGGAATHRSRLALVGVGG